MNPDIMSEVINRPLQILTVNVSEGDHQAQIDPGKSTATYQLIEHEYSRRIKMNHFKTLPSCLRLNDLATLSSLQEPFPHGIATLRDAMPASSLILKSIHLETV